MDQSTASQPANTQPEPVNMVPPVIPAQPVVAQPADSQANQVVETGTEQNTTAVVDTPPVTPATDTAAAGSTVPADASTGQAGQVQVTEPKTEAEPVISLQSDIPTPPNAMSGPLKEFGPPTAAPAPEAPAPEVVTPTDAEPDIPQEVKEAGVEATPNTDQPNVPKQVQQATGIMPVNDAVPVPVAPTLAIDLPMPEAEATQVIKTRKVSESIRWLATQILEQAKRAHGQLLGKK